MVTTLEGREPGAAPAPRRSDVDVLLDQVRGVEAWTAAHRQPAAGQDAATSREALLDVRRRRDVVTRSRHALVGWTARQLEDSDRLLRSSAATRAVVAHRNARFRDEVVTGLQAEGVAVVADLDNGAEALGVVVAEQPDLLLLEHKLPMVGGPALVREVCLYAPRTVVVVQVEQDREIGPLLEAGARSVFTRRTRAAALAEASLSALTD